MPGPRSVSIDRASHTLRCVPRRSVCYRDASTSSACRRSRKPCARSDRKQLTRLMGALEKGGRVGSHRLDRLARSTRDLFLISWRRCRKGAGFKSLKIRLNTTTAHGRLMLTVLGGLAEFERELIRTRTGEGRERAKARGVILGRKPKLTGHQRREAIARREAGEVLTDIARSYNVSHSTISRLS